jgi:hypothetical protein
MMRFAFGGGLAGTGLLCLVAAACGPSFQAVYEGEVHFEHCYAMDQKAGPVEEKKDCWRDWLRGYTYGQSNDRVEYAATRFSQLSLDPMLPTEEEHAGARKEGRTLAAPLPTSAFAPPPNMVERNAPDASVPAPEAHSAKAPEPPPPAPAPASDCVRTCDERWNSCHAACKDSKDKPTCESCDKAYRTCMPACFREAAPQHSK